MRHLLHLEYIVQTIVPIRKRFLYVADPATHLSQQQSLCALLGNPGPSWLAMPP
jgi:hypothetical protein